MIKVTDLKKGEYIMHEEDEGDLFYTIMQGEVEVLKYVAVQVYPEESKKLKVEEKAKLYFDFIKLNYDNIFWHFMTIEKNQLDKLLFENGSTTKGSK